MSVVKKYLAEIGGRGGRAGRGAAKARTSEQARSAAQARWAKKCVLCGGTGWQEVTPGQAHACECKRSSLANSKDEPMPMGTGSSNGNKQSNT